MSSELAAGLKRARAAKAWTIRRLAAEAGVASGTVQRYEKDDPGVITPQTLRKIADALGVKVVQTDEGEWVVRPMDSQTGSDAVTASHSVVTDGGSVLVLRAPAGFMESLTAEQRQELEADALLEVMRLARAATRRA